MEPPALETIERYKQRFMDVEYWTPYVRAACAQQGLAPCQAVRGGFPGTYPTFIIEGRWVVKFFGALYDGPKNFVVERAMGLLLQEAPLIPAPPLLREGSLLEEGDGWHWPYLVFPFVAGLSLRQVADYLGQPERESVAHWLGAVVRQIHRLPLEGTVAFSTGWDDYLAFLEQQRRTCWRRQQQWGSLPPALLPQIEHFLLPLTELIDENDTPVLLHADLTEDHLLGSIVNGRWQAEAVIDFGDARTGDLFYELVALHLDTFRLDKQLLRLFLAGYGWTGETGSQFARRALSITLLHQFDVFRPVFERFPQLRQVGSLAELADRIWNLSVPGVTGA